MDLIYLGLGIIIGTIIGSLGILLFQKIKKDEIENTQGSDVFDEIGKLKKEVEKYNKSADEDRGAVGQILTDMRTAVINVGDSEKEIKRTLVTGGGQKQGAWGQMMLEHILQNKLQFTKGQEFETQKSLMFLFGVQLEI